MSPDLDKALTLIDAAHSEDPNTFIPANAPIDTIPTPYELHYASKMTSYLSRLESAPSDNLALAIRAQHFRRWEVPRSSYPMTKIGYHSWRTGLKKRQAALVGEILLSCSFAQADVDRVMSLIQKQGLKEGDKEAQTLEDVACLVFLDDQFEEFKEKHDEDKIIGILRKTWGKMSERGRQEALDMQMEDDCRRLVEKALAG